MGERQVDPYYSTSELATIKWNKLKSNPELHKSHLERRKQRQKQNAHNALSLAGADVSKLDSGICAGKGCITILNKYNPSIFCCIHENKIVSYTLLDYLQKNNCINIVKREIKKEINTIWDKGEANE
jgi:hypothetical protein